MEQDGIRKEIIIPGSKSITNRVLLRAAIGETPVTLHNLLESDDTVHMRGVLSGFGVQFDKTGDKSLLVTPPTQLRGDDQSHFIGNAGTVARFVSAVSLIIQGNYGLNGVDRMHERPQGDLFVALRQLGVSVTCEGTAGFLPAQYEGLGGELAERTVTLSGRVSSQFVSALLLVAPRIKGGLRIEMDEIPPSQPYVDMTLEILRHWGVSFTTEEGGRVMDIAEGLTAPAVYTIPADMSGASYPSAWATLSQHPLRIRDYGSVTLQGDEGFADICAHFGATVQKDGEDCSFSDFGASGAATTFDFSPMPDVAMTGMAMACFYEGDWKFEGLESLRVKECDRIQAMVDGFTQLGIRTVVEGDDVTISGGTYWQSADNLARLQAADIETNSHDDHRIAMCFGVLRSALAQSSGTSAESLFTIGEPHCVAKTWPEFWTDLADWEASV